MDLSDSYSPTDSASLSGLERDLGYSFEDFSLLQRALTHSSSTIAKGGDNERLEFFGDAVLDMVVCEYLFHNYPDRSEGDLTEIKSEIVRRRTLAEAGKRLGIERHLKLGRGITSHARIPDSLSANCFEAIIAAIYLDSGYGSARDFVLRHLGDDLDKAASKPVIPNYKSFLQQYLQRESGEVPQYEVVAESGPDHLKTFEVVAKVDGQEKGRGTGQSKKEAEMAAAKAALEVIENEPGDADSE